MADIHKLELVEVGDDFRFDPNEILEAAKGQGLVELVILGTLEDGSHWTSSTANAGETLILMERAKRQIVFGEE